MMTGFRYKQPKNPLFGVQQTEKEIRCDVGNKLMKNEMRKQEFR